MTAASAFLLTVAVESPVYVLGLRRRLGLLAAAALAVLVNVLTHPLAWRLTAAHRTWVTFAAVELGVCAAEALLLLTAGWALARRRRPPTAPLGAREAVLLALSANALSAGAGLLAM